ncbi:hypothetical protein CLG96_14930 [Sphingomonas oleivorans]|uniref:DUF1449 domain-containing protein n=1 Tax=Sphingomonas oleivorans TaxID=1735121 RepID=A0A2T5FUV7_9SPHN|nr:YqiJ family protein [Sphingomonas oleivorans]PTQ08499.1 hypothetical protein CLG96_14930 [Sphingomonas oleivorans]
MLTFLGAADNIVFSTALVLMLLIGLVEAIGLGTGAMDLDLDGDAGGLLGWLGIGRLPLLMLLVAFLASFGLIGLAGQQAALSLSGALLPALIAVPAAGVAALPVTGLAARLLARILPHDETSAVSLDSLVGRSATIIVGRASRGSPAKARVRDVHGQPHYVMVEPDTPGQSFAEGEQILLVRREDAIFRAIIDENPRFSNWIER